MDFKAAFEKRGGALSSSRVREQSSNEVLNKAKAERAARQAERERQRAAITLSRWWRGSNARSASRQRFQRAWLADYGPLVGQPQTLLPTEQLCGSVLPPVLAAYLPGLAQREQRAALAGGTALPSVLLDDTAALRGCFALLLRSLASADAAHNLLAAASSGAVTAGIAAGAAGTAEEARCQRQAQLLGQLCRLLLLCCGLIGGSTIAAASSSSTQGPEPCKSVDPLLQAAAGRLVGILCDSGQWKCFAPQQAQQQQQQQMEEQRRMLQQGLHGWLAPLPLLSAAVRRLVAALPAGPEQQQGQQQQQQQLGVLNILVLAELRLWRQLSALPNKGGGGDGTPGNAASEAAHQLLCMLAIPGLLPHLAPATVAQLTACPGFTALLETSAGWHPAAAASSGSGGGSTLCLLGSLSQLAAGKKASLQQGKGQEGKQVSYLQPSALLQQPGVAPALATAATALLLRALDPSSGASGGNSGSRGVDLDALWPFAEGTLAAQLLPLLLLPQYLCLYHLLLLLADASNGSPSRHSGGNDNSSSGGGGGGSGGGVGGGGKAWAARLLSALAFGTQLLPRVWRHLATSIGLPLEAPLQATRGWEVATLRQGIAGLQPEAAAQLGLFCRVYCHFLQVADDYEFHEKQQPFTLGQQRAIAAALNTLVFRTQLPDRPTGGAARSGSTKPGRDHSMLQQAAPLLHRALHERDARRPFCPPALWLEPYHHLTAPSGSPQQQPQQPPPPPQQQPVSGAAVVRALLAAADGEGGTGGPLLLPHSTGAYQATAATSAAASRPAAVAAVLTAAPQCVPFDERVSVFRALIDQDKERCGFNLAPVDGGSRPFPLTIRRVYVLEDAVAQLGRLGSCAKTRLSLTFINQQGLQEAGIDMGGLLKEFLEAVVAAGFDLNRGLFSATPDGCAYPNPLAERLDGGLAALETLGLVLGRALYEGLLLDLPLAPFFVSRLQGRWPLFDELQSLDPEVYRSLMQLKRFDGDVADLCLDFTVESDFLGSKMSEELVPGGSRVGVTNANVLQYVYLVADWHLNKRLGPSAAAFSRGLSKVIPAPWLRLFSPREVNQLLGGGDAAALDVDDMQAHVQYSNGYSASSTTVKHFWAVVRGLGQEEQRALLKFVTSCSRAPLGGFQHLNPPLTIHKVDCGASLLASVGGKDVDRLPTASTCSNTLKLPNFRRTTTLREKLLYAIRSGAGFELS